MLQAMSHIIGALVALYLAALLYIAWDLKLHHKAVWDSLGRPSLLNWSISSSFRLGRYVFMSGAHRRLGDTKLTTAIYGTRVLVLVIIFAIVLWRSRQG